MNVNRRILVTIAGLFLVSGLVTAKGVMGDIRPTYGSTVYGNISLESKNPKQVYAEIIKICQEMGASITSFNTYTQPQGRTQVSAQMQIDKDKAAELLTKFAGTAEVKNQNLSNGGYGQNPEQIKKQIDELEKELKDIVVSRHPVLAAYGLQQKQNLQAQLQQMDPGKSFATISLNIQEPNSDIPGAGKSDSIKWSTLAAILAPFVIGLILGNMLPSLKATVNRK